MAKLNSQFTANEIEFLAEDELIGIVPTFSLDNLSLISGDYGPFKPSIPIKVPLWLAVTLKKRQKCKIQPPSWIHIDYLTERLEGEKNNQFCQDLPFHFKEIAIQLFNCASDDIINVQNVRGLLQDIWNLRHAKLRQGLLSLDGNKAAYKLNKVSAMEINSIRPFFVHAMNQFHTLAKGTETNTTAINTQTTQTQTQT